MSLIGCSQAEPNAGSCFVRTMHAIDFLMLHVASESLNNQSSTNVNPKLIGSLKTSNLKPQTSNNPKLLTLNS